MAVDSIRELHSIGRSLNAPASGTEDSGRMSIADVAAREGMNADTVRKARRFADPDEGYTPAELDDLCEQIRRVQGAQAVSKPVFGRTHVLRILSVPERGRKGLQAAAIRGAWSTAELEAEIAARYGSRRDGGRKRRIPADTLGLLAQVEGQCEAWRRWHAAAVDLVAAKDDFPAAVRDRLADAVGAVGRLHRAATDALKTRRPGRGVRRPFREAGGG